jgi:hypothetical protein
MSSGSALCRNTGAPFLRCSTRDETLLAVLGVRRKAETLEMGGVGLFASAEYCRQFMIGLGTKPGNKVVHSSETEMKEADAAEDLQSLQDKIKTAVDVSHGPIYAGLDMLKFSRAGVVEAEALGLRQVERAISFMNSHGLPAS